MSTATNLINEKATADRKKRGRGGGGESNVDLGVSIWGDSARRRFDFRVGFSKKHDS